MFTDDSSFFSEVNEIDTSANDLNHDLEKISEWAFQWKMKFNSDPTKQAQELTFGEKKKMFLTTQLYILLKLP